MNIRALFAGSLIGLLGCGDSSSSPPVSPAPIETKVEVVPSVGEFKGEPVRLNDVVSGRGFYPVVPIDLGYLSLKYTESLIDYDPARNAVRFLRLNGGTFEYVPCDKRCLSGFDYVPDLSFAGRVHGVEFFVEFDVDVYSNSVRQVRDGAYHEVSGSFAPEFVSRFDRVGVFFDERFVGEKEFSAGVRFGGLPPESLEFRVVGFNDGRQAYSRDMVKFRRD